jgi:hypothetical protein
LENPRDKLFVSENLQGKCFCVCDFQGLFVGVARRLAESGARVLYQTPVDKRKLFNDAVVGGGIEGVDLIKSFWDYKNEIDAFVFPDIEFEAEQRELREQGFAVWGAGAAMNLELDRLFFLKKLAELGLDVPPHEVVRGLSRLVDYLKNKQDIWIKVSEFRGSFETFHWRSWRQDEHNIACWSFKFGGIKEHIVFICFPKIETELEIGVDSYNVGGKWPSMMLHGIEEKNEGYFSAVTPFEKMPEQIVPIMKAFSPYLKEAGCASQISMEVRVAKEGNFFIDFTARGGLPSSASFLKCKNAPEIFFYGAHGELVEPDYGFKFSCEAMVKIHGSPESWETVELAAKVGENLMLSDYCEVNGKIWFPADEGGSITDIGWLVATGDTPTETAETINKLADELPDGADANVEAIASVIREIESEHQEGIEFTKEKMPDPSIVLEPS